MGVKKLKLAIVGTSHLTENENLDARIIILWLIRNHPETTEIVTGDALGIDRLVSEITLERGLQLHAFTSAANEWQAYKIRNEFIAEYCDILYCITTKTKNTPCYHCKLDHQRTGGCWTMKYAKGLNKETHLVII